MGNLRPSDQDSEVTAMRAIDESFNGYTNYATWSVKLILDNTESLYHYCKNIVAAAVEVYGEDRNKIIRRIAETIENLVNDMKPKTNNDIWNQLMVHVNSEVNYWEIGKTLLEDWESEQ